MSGGLKSAAERKRLPGESPMEHAKRIYQPLVSVDELAGIVREGKSTITSPIDARIEGEER